MSGAAPVQLVNSDLSAHASNYNEALCSASLSPAFTHNAIVACAHHFTLSSGSTFDSDLLPACQQDCCVAQFF